MSDIIFKIIEISLIVAAILLTIRELHEYLKTRSLDGFLSISNEFKKLTKTREYIYEKFANLANFSIINHYNQNFHHKKSISNFSLIPHISTSLFKSQVNLTDIENKKIEWICVSFDRIGVLIDHKIIPKDVAFSMYFDVVLRTWFLLEPFILIKRKNRRNDRWMIYFEKLNNECWKHWIRLIRKNSDFRHYKSPIDIYRYQPGKDYIMHKYCPKCGGDFEDRNVQDDNIKRKVCKECGFIYYRNPKPCVGVIIIDEKRILLVKRAREPFKGLWDIPGGFIEYDEDPKSAAIREFFEETGCEIETINVYGIFMDKYGAEKDSTLNICYQGKIIKGNLNPRGDIEDIQFFEKESLPSNDDIAFDWPKDVIKKLINENIL